MSLTLLLIRRLALHSLLINRLQQITQLHGAGGHYGRRDEAQLTRGFTPQPASLPHLEIPLNRVKADTPTYVSAIALKLAQQWDHPALEIAEELASHLVHTIEAENHAIESIDAEIYLIGQQIWQHVTIWVRAPGWIYLQVGETGFAKWLQHFMTCLTLVDRVIDRATAPDFLNHSSYLIRSYTDLTKLGRNITVSPDPTARPTSGFEDQETALRSSTEVFLAQYAHARCCSLLRLANQENRLALCLNTVRLHPSGLTGWNGPNSDRETPLPTSSGTTRLPTSLQWQVIEPTPLPWLDDQHLLRCRHIAQQQFLTDLIEVLDTESIAPAQPIELLKKIHRLTQKFLKLEASCPIANPAEPAASVQVQVGLILIAQIVLQTLLQEGLGLEAPGEL